MTTTAPIRAYMAGPWVFRPPSEIAVFKDLVLGMCKEKFQGAILPLFPMDPIINGDRPPLVMDISDPQKIAAHCRRHIKSCDVIVADVTPFRGVQPDPGTVLEIGIAHCAGKRIVLYTDGPVLPLRERLIAAGWMKAGDERDIAGSFVEDFGRPVDTMLSAYPYFESVTEALAFEWGCRDIPDPDENGPL